MPVKVKTKIDSITKNVRNIFRHKWQDKNGDKKTNI